MSPNHPPSTDASTDWQDVVSCLDGLRAGIAIFNRHGALEYANQHFYSLFGSLDVDIQTAETALTFDALILHLKDKARPDDETLHDLRGWLDDRTKRQSEGDLRPVELRLADGRWIQIKERDVDNGSRIMLWSDVSELRRTQIRLEDALSAMSGAFAFWDHDDRLVACNKRFADFLREQDVKFGIGEHYVELIDRLTSARLFDMPLGPTQWRRDRLDKHAEAISQDVITHHSGHDFLIKEHRTRDGGTASIITDVSEIKEKEREIIYWGNAVERTKSALVLTRNKMKEQAHSLHGLNQQLSQVKAHADQAETALSTFMRSMSTEIRTPLHSIIGFAELIKAELYGPVGDARYRDYAEVILRSGNHLLRLVMRILEISKIQAGRYELECAPEEVAPILERCVSAIKQVAQKKGLTVELSVPDDLPQIEIDALTTQALINELLQNAVDFTEQGGKITVKAERESMSVVISIIDTGAGVPHEDLERIMLPFEKGRDARSGDYSRGGLGLPLARELTELQQGTLDISSVEGEGMTVRVQFPLMQAKPSFADIAAVEDTAIASVA